MVKYGESPFITAMRKYWMKVDKDYAKALEMQMFRGRQMGKSHVRKMFEEAIEVGCDGKC